MLKNISNLGIVLNKSEKQFINGEGARPKPCSSDIFIIGDYCYICNLQYPASYCH